MYIGKGAAYGISEPGKTQRCLPAFCAFLGWFILFSLDSLPSSSPLYFPPPPPFFFSSIPNPVPTPLAPFLHGASFLPALSNSPALPCQVDSAKYRKYSCRGNRGKTPPRGLSGAPPPLQLQPPPPPTPRRYFHYSSNITSPPLSPHTRTHKPPFPSGTTQGLQLSPPPPSPAL